MNGCICRSNLPSPPAKLAEDFPSETHLWLQVLEEQVQFRPDTLWLADKSHILTQSRSWLRNEQADWHMDRVIQAQIEDKWLMNAISVYLFDLFILFFCVYLVIHHNTESRSDSDLVSLTRCICRVSRSNSFLFTGDGYNNWYVPLGHPAPDMTHGHVCASSVPGLFLRASCGTRWSD